MLRTCCASDRISSWLSPWLCNCIVLLYLFSWPLLEWTYTTDCNIATYYILLFIFSGLCWRQLFHPGYNIFGEILCNLSTITLPTMADLVPRPADDRRHLGFRACSNESNSGFQSFASAANRSFSLQVSYTTFTQLLVITIVIIIIVIIVIIITIILIIIKIHEIKYREDEAK